MNETQHSAWTIVLWIFRIPSLSQEREGELRQKYRQVPLARRVTLKSLWGLLSIALFVVLIFASFTTLGLVLGYDEEPWRGDWITEENTAAVGIAEVAAIVGSILGGIVLAMAITVGIARKRRLLDEETLEAFVRSGP